MNEPNAAMKIKAAITAIFSFCTVLWGRTGWAVVILFLAIVLDYITGSWAAIQQGKWSSGVARQGLWHKVGEIAALCVAALCDIAVNVLTDGVLPDSIGGLTLPTSGFTLLVCFWYTFTELGSVIENVAEMGAPVPRFLTNAIEKLRNATSKEGGTEETDETP